MIPGSPGRGVWKTLPSATVISVEYEYTLAVNVELLLLLILTNSVSPNKFWCILYLTAIASGDTGVVLVLPPAYGLV